MLITHHPSISSDISQTSLEDIKKRLSQCDNLFLHLEETLSLVDQLAAFELGQFLLENKGLNGYWTAYIIMYGKNKQHLTPLEYWLLNEAPGILATQERFRIFQRAILNYLKPGMHIASLPCGLMEDYLSLPSDCLKNIDITGIDLDEHSLKLAQKTALDRNLTCQVLKRDAWCLGLTETFDLITSNGLNIYEPNPEKLIRFYQEIANALRPEGILITSYLSHPDDKAKPPAQKKIKLQDGLRQKAIFQDIVQAKWQCYQTQEAVNMQFQAAGLFIKDIIYDTQCLFPTIIAQKN
ncbi:class I SAM-dependent methyltransferase [Legionella fairfieldensis]|uniref:class I SAM-dependent methyltransferase n=1 Tax=Legionella fairfieldensis TaxID=45064 RepID=UPI000686E067|nr:class I SAM-dependent methyltransferase [Legionella fairfieldensis]